jgi:hypothetical protein
MEGDLSEHKAGTVPNEVRGWSGRDSTGCHTGHHAILVRLVVPCPNPGTLYSRRSCQSCHRRIGTQISRFGAMLPRYGEQRLVRISAAPHAFSPTIPVTHGDTFHPT